MHYDIAAKVLMEKCREEILRRFVGLSVSKSSLLQELPQETASVKRSDFPILVTEESGAKRLVLLEIQSRWERDIPLRLLDYRSRYLLRQDVEAISCVILLKPSSEATAVYEDNEVRFAYRLIPIYELDAREIVADNVLCLMPFVPLMKHGEELIEKADLLLYESVLPREDKADMLTVLTIFSGLVSTRLPQMLVSRRRDIMIESAAYEIIKQEGRQEGLNEGRQEGLNEGRQEGLNEGRQEGLKKGREEGRIEEAREGILENLEARFDVVPESIIKEVRGIGELEVLKALRRKSAKIDNLHAFRDLLKKAKE